MTSPYQGTTKFALPQANSALRDMIIFNLNPDNLNMNPQAGFPWERKICMEVNDGRNIRYIYTLIRTKARTSSPKLKMPVESIFCMIICTQSCQGGLKEIKELLDE